MECITLFQREKRGLSITVCGPDGEPFDLEGFNVEWRAQIKDHMVKKTIGDGVDIVDAKKGELLVSLYPDDLYPHGKYRMEIRISNVDISITVLSDTFTVEPSLFGGA